MMAVSRELNIEVFPPGAHIISEGEHGEKMYFLHRGEVEILVGPQETKVATLSDGNVFGEMALFGSCKRTATVRARESCDCRVIHHRVFGQILRSFPSELKFFRGMAAERLGQTRQAKREERDKLGGGKDDIFRRGVSDESDDLYVPKQHVEAVSRRRTLAEKSWAERAKYEAQRPGGRAPERRRPGARPGASASPGPGASPRPGASPTGAREADAQHLGLPAVPPPSPCTFDGEGSKAPGDVSRSRAGDARLLPMGELAGAGWSWQEQLCALLAEPAPHLPKLSRCGNASVCLTSRSAAHSPEPVALSFGVGPLSSRSCLSGDVAGRWLHQNKGPAGRKTPSIGLLELAAQAK